VISGHDAQPLIEERLGRPMLDELEAAVVLEAFAGLEADLSLQIGRDAARFRSSVGETPPFERDRTTLDWASVLSDAAFIVGVLAIGFWLSGQGGELGAVAVDRSWRLALPISLGAQWFLRRRVLVGPEGLGRLRRESWLFGPAAAAIIGLCVVPDGGVIAAALATTWVAGFLVSRRGWGLVHMAVVGVTLLVAKWLPIWAVFAILVTASAALAAAALGASPVSDRMAGSFARSLPSGCIGVSLALILVAEPPILWGATPLQASLTVVPALVGALAGGLWMTRIWTAVPQSLARTPIASKRTPRASLRVFAEAVVLSIVVVQIVSIAVLFWLQGNAAELGRTTRSLLIAHAALAVAGLCVSSLEAFGRWSVGLVSAGGGAVGAWLLAPALHVTEPGERILAGAAVALAIAFPVLLVTLHRPAHRIVVSV
jgi:hypothetical protein